MLITRTAERFPAPVCELRHSMSFSAYYVDIFPTYCVELSTLLDNCVPFYTIHGAVSLVAGYLVSPRLWLPYERVPSGRLWGRDPFPPQDFLLMGTFPGVPAPNPTDRAVPGLPISRFLPFSTMVIF